MLRLIDQALFAELSAAAGQAPRRRVHRNFHPDDVYPAHRLLVAIEPGSYVPPHRHLNPAKDETLLVLRGRLGVVFFDDQGGVQRSAVLAAGGDAVGVDVPHGVFHSVLALEPGTVIFEAKAGPYVPIAPEERAAWAPAEGDAAVPDYLASIRAVCLGAAA
ncbi:WbuC family cupin fold metalloprotein [Dechloromonas sp. XY25]|uniref:WbuC family cupin fold metalloprotein n=1 Tax=Dechloromonas hankyongensis TaxID=2908002 RepID=A0ABS9K5Q9_9RHOO|nr:WbuC family cupin fold metalloprotein [Dechloromonas hankyongensis]MCG2578502.1 WbuC family cupin fold metalloprotein [Dechloromonas hankyongensis]